MPHITNAELDTLEASLKKGQEVCEMLVIIGEILGTVDPDELKSMRRDAEAYRLERVSKVSP